MNSKFHIHDDHPPRRGRVVFHVQSRRPKPGLVLLTAAFTALICGGLCVAAILARAPAAVVPMIALICVGCPMLAGWQVPTAVASLRAQRSKGQALAALRRGLAQLPETEHPLGL